MGTVAQLVADYGFPTVMVIGLGYFVYFVYFVYLQGKILELWPQTPQIENAH